MSTNNKNKKQQQQQAQGNNKTTQPKKSKAGKKNEKTVKKSSSILPWILGSFVILGAITAALVYDVSAHGGKFESSATGKFLADIGALPHVQNAVTTTLKYSARGYKWGEVNVPIYYKSTRTYLEPYADLSKDLGILIYNGACKQFGNLKNATLVYSPIVADFIDKYVPGLSEKIHNFVVSTCSTVCTLSVDAYGSLVNILQTKIFVGQLSPENIGKALNTTQIAAAEYYSWFYDKVDFYAKIK